MNSIRVALACGIAAAVAACSGGSGGNTSGEPGPALSLSTTTVTIPVTQSAGALPAAQTVTVSNSGGGTLAAPTLSVSYGAGAGWLEASISGLTITIRPNTTALAAGSYSATVHVSSAGATGSPKSIAVSWQLTANANPVIVSTPSSLSFTAQVGGSDPGSQTLTVTNGGGGSLATVTVGEDAAWLTPSIAGSTVTVAAALGSLTGADYTGHVILTSAGAANNPVSVPVTFHVLEPTLAVSTTTMSFSATVGANSPDQTRSIGNSGTGTLGTVTATPSYTTGSGWISAAVTGAGNSRTLTVSITAPGTVGTYDGSVAIASANTTNTPVSIPIHLVISAQPQISASPTSLSFTTTVGTDPANQSVTVGNAGGGTLAAVTATPSYVTGSGWMSASVTGSGNSQTVTVSVTAPGAGSYSGNVSIASDGASNTPVSVPVTLTVNSGIPPAAPTNVTVLPSNGAAIVTFTPSSGATSYNVYYGTTSGLTTSSAKVSATGPMAIVPSLANGARQFFAVSAVGGGGESALSPPRCGVPTASDTALSSNSASFAVYDALCDDRLDGTLWYNPSDYAASVVSGAAELTVDAADLGAFGTTGLFEQEGINVAAGASRVTTLSALMTVPSATAATTGSAEIRASLRLIYAPPALRLNYPAPFRDWLFMDIGLIDVGTGLYAYRRSYHCDDGTCGVNTSTGIATLLDPVSFGTIGNTAFLGAPASYDTPYRFTASLDETSGLFHWSIAGGPEFVTTVSGTFDPSAYLAATSGWSGIPLAGSGFDLAQIAARTLDESLAGGGSGKITMKVEDVQVGFNNNAAASWDNFSGTAPNSGPTELSLARWSLVGAPRVLPTGTGSFGIHAQMTGTGSLVSTGQGIVLANPELIDVFQVDVNLLSFTTSGGSANASGNVGVTGRFMNDGTGTTRGSAVGDVYAAVFLNVNTGTAPSWFIGRCTAQTCSTLSLLGSGSFPGGPVAPGLHPVRVGFDPYANEYVFGVGTTILYVPPPAGATFVAPARAPMKRVFADLSIPATAGTNATLDVQLNNVLVATSPPAGPPPTCTTLDPTTVPSVAGIEVASAAPVPAGGTIADGTYVLTGLYLYTGVGGASGPTGSSQQWLLRITGSNFEDAAVGGFATAVPFSGTFATSGTIVLLSETCPVTEFSSYGYTASPTEVRLYFGAGEAVFTRQ